MRSKNIKINGTNTTAILMCGGKGFKIYSSLENNLILSIGRKNIVLAEHSPEWKIVIDYVNINYQNANVKDSVKDSFDRLRQTLS